MTEFNLQIEKRSTRMQAVVFGIMVIVAGLVLIFNNMGMIEPELKKVLISWQMLLIVAGFINLFGRTSRLLGLILIAVGGFFILPKFMDLPENFTATFWPLIVVIAGLLIVFFSLKRIKRFGLSEKSKTDEYLDDVVVFGGVERSVSSDFFKGGKTVNIFGGSVYNLSQCKLAENTNVLEMVCVFGGTKLIVPNNWNIKMEVSSVLGGFVDKRHIVKDESTSDRILIIKGVGVFGGGEIVSN